MRHIATDCTNCDSKIENENPSLIDGILLSRDCRQLLRSFTTICFSM